jgi:GNAT superfamily N-acetyltransferase
MPNYETMTVDDIDAFVVDHRDDFECGIEQHEIAAAVAAGRAVTEARTYGFAVVQQGSAGPHLWFVYIDPSARGNGLGRRFVRELVQAHGADRHMTLQCYGPRRRAFFGSAGFRVESRDGEWRTMTTNRLSRGAFLGV